MISDEVQIAAVVVWAYVMIHIFFGPLDWYLWYKLYSKLKRKID